MAVKKKYALFPIAYDEVSLVDEGAAGSANVSIIKMYPTGDGPSPKSKPKKKSKDPLKPKKDFLETSRAREKKLRSEAKSEGRGSKSWEKKIKRAPSGSPAGGEFAQTSSENKRKYGKGGTTKAKLEGTRDVLSTDRPHKKGKNGYGRKMRDKDGDGDHDARRRKDGLIKSGTLGDVKQVISDWGDIPKKGRERQKAHLLKRAKSLGASKALLAKINSLPTGGRTPEEITSDPEQQAAIRRRRKNKGKKTASAEPLPPKSVPVGKSALSTLGRDARTARTRSILERN